ncbi:hypothetical protein GCM10009662_52550 [Catellatospora coxensis]|uniref:Uncharacterized protein n=1 Tax=Catellatospora coxensis TaxID=310354 RepID=A0A8J3L307_9ACTN|nr:hypothetical protein Cco03nite_82550 [Catellatospora coxensis]
MAEVAVLSRLRAVVVGAVTRYLLALSLLASGVVGNGGGNAAVTRWSAVTGGVTAPGAGTSPLRRVGVRVTVGGENRPLVRRTVAENAPVRARGGCRRVDEWTTGRLRAVAG